MHEDAIGLADAIRAVRHELNLALKDVSAPTDRVGFRYGAVEIELELVLSREVGADAGARFFVVSLGGRAARKDASTHRIRISLEPFDRLSDDHRPLEVTEPGGKD
jgi:hypothetical protein